MANGKLEIVSNDPRSVTLDVRHHTPAQKHDLFAQLLAMPNIVSIKFVNNGGYGGDTVEVEYAILDLALQMASMSQKIQDLVKTS